MEEAIATAFGIGLGAGALVAIAATVVTWLAWVAARRWGPPSFRGPASGFPGFPIAMILMVIALPVGCAWSFAPRPQPAGLRLVRAVEIPLRTPTDRADLIALFRRHAGTEGMIFVDTTDSWRNAPPDVRKTLYISLDRPVGRRQEWEIEAADDGSGTDPWVTFLRGVDPARATAARGRLIAALKARFPDAPEVPVMPTGALPLRRDLERFGSDYRVRADRAAQYQLSPPASSPR
jgi:hypothetical protein